MKKLSNRHYVIVALIYFVIAAMLGVTLRFLYVLDIDLNYRYVVHGHSHIALLGWVYLGLTTLLVALYLKKEVLKKYRIIFWSTQITLIGMLFSFPIQGYGMISILFSTLFILVSYVFTWFFIKNIPLDIKKSNSYKCIRIGLFYMILSSLGPWSLGIIMNSLGPDSVWYRIAIYFYLHFQYNGWMILVLLGLFLKVLEMKGKNISVKKFKEFFYVFNLGIILSFFLSTLWTSPNAIFFFVAGLGAILQLLGFYKYTTLILIKHKFKTTISRLQDSMFRLFLFLILIKFVLQILSAIPFVAEIISRVLDFTIGYLHWTFLGVVTIGILFFMEYYKLIKISFFNLILYSIAFFSTEFLIFYKGGSVILGYTVFNSYYETLAIISLLLLLAVLYMLVNTPFKK